MNDSIRLASSPADALRPVASPLSRIGQSLAREATPPRDGRSDSSGFDRDRTDPEFPAPHSPPVCPLGTALHVVAVLTLLATFPLVFMGGLVTSTGAGLAVPDWPNSYGYNMWLFPPSMWIGGIFYEHTHRLLGTLVGFLSVAMALFAFAPAKSPRLRKALGLTAILLVLGTVASLVAKLILGSAIAGSSGTTLQKLLPHLVTGFGSLALVAGVAYAARTPDPRRWVRWFSLAILGCVILQGIKGGLRVELISIELAIAHGIFGQVVLCLIAAMCLFTSAEWANAPRSGGAFPGARKLAWTASLVVGLVLCQLVVGAAMRHYGAGLAIPDLPLAYGKLLPPTTDAALADANRYRISLADAAIGPTELYKVWLHFGHRVGAIIVSLAMLHLCFTALRTLRRWGRPAKVGIYARVLLVLLAAQVTLGLATVYYRKPADITTLHHTCGALLLMLTTLLALRCFRLARAHSLRAVPPPDAELSPSSVLAAESKTSPIPVTA